MLTTLARNHLEKREHGILMGFFLLLIVNRMAISMAFHDDWKVLALANLVTSIIEISQFQC